MLSKERIHSIRECKLKWHCHEIVFVENNSTVNHQFNGHGVLTNKNGELKLEFVCVNLSEIARPVTQENKEFRYTMTAKTTDGYTIIARDIKAYLIPKEEPIVYHIRINHIECHFESQVEDNNEHLLEFEYHGKARIPYNKYNTTTSSISGVTSHTLNQSNYDVKGLKVKFIFLDAFMNIKIYENTNNLDIYKFKKALIFYLSFISGSLVQPYYIFLKNKGSSIVQINSIDTSAINVGIGRPISDCSMEYNGKTDHWYYVDLFKNICDRIYNDETVIDSISSHLNRICYSSLSSNLNVKMLTIPVSIEGILIDIFKPKISEMLKDEQYEQDKINIISKINLIDDISEKHKETLVGHVNNWGNIHAKKMLVTLVDKEVIEKYQLKAWESLRHSCAHPKLVERDSVQWNKNKKNMFINLGLFYRLVLNIFSYKGGQYEYKDPSKRSEHKAWAHIDILKY